MIKRDQCNATCVPATSQTICLPCQRMSDTFCSAIAQCERVFSLGEMRRADATRGNQKKASKAGIIAATDEYATKDT